ncbi:hypothetical protein HID58_025263 [Brassica napus]|uniref:F-box domain-containing protein n=2 Tax=Brassica TaxID=3705 RepID=A0ABQ8CLY6_BRANA|nr:putative F-box protein At1g32660 [Brassica napus]KAH0917603.1 hypothetical protein HID58_025263 [Brassica napus]CAG7901191.1 unnamed protein product [Brassica rapa]VDC96406.1 unnamed protein product [Brassica rapa]
MKRKEREEERLCRSRSKIGPIAVDLKTARVTRLPARSTHQEALPQRKKEADGNETSPSSKFDSLPFDLKMAIVSRMGAKSLMKFRCVSKIWSSIIRSRGFIDSFFSMSSKQSRFIVALANGVCNEPEAKLTFFFSFGESCSSSSLVPNLEMAIPVGLSSIRESFASLHGFLTVGVHGGLMVCNPSTEQVIKLHSSTRFVGYDPIEGQHKALFVESRVSRSSVHHHLDHKVLTLGGGSCQEWRLIEGTPGPYRPISVGVCVNGVIYYGARNSPHFRNPVMVCFDVRTEKLSFIQAHETLLRWGKDSIFIDYNGKLASIVRYPYDRFNSFDLWILEDPVKHEWSKQHCVFPSSVWDSVWGFEMSFPGTNKDGEIIMAPTSLSPEVGPFYIFYYNVKTQNVRRVRLLGIGDNKEFRRSYGFLKQRDCFVRIAPQHVHSIASL